MPKDDIDSFCPTSQEDWRDWLENNHASKQAVWLIYYKSAANKPTLSWSEAVDEALCFGWIDSTKHTIDHERYKQYFTRRKPKSIWSKVNKEKVARLIQDKRMTQAGLDSIETAKQNGSWTSLDAVEALEIPEDLQQALAREETATAYFESLSKSWKKILLHWVISAKRPATRAKRIAEIAECANQGLKPKQFG